MSSLVLFNKFFLYLDQAEYILLFANLKQSNINLKYSKIWGSLGGSVKCPTLGYGSGHDLRVVTPSPMGAPCWVEILPLPLPLPVSAPVCAHVCVCTSACPLFKKNSKIFIKILYTTVLKVRVIINIRHLSTFLPFQSHYPDTFTFNDFS